MLKKTQVEIAARIVDCAAGLFAKYGLENTSLQQIADSTGYTKAGVLHHFSSKRAIYDAVLDTTREELQDMLAHVEHVPVGGERDKAVVEMTVDLTFRWPGVSAFGNRFIYNDQGDDPDLARLGETMISALGFDPEAAGVERLVRVTAAFTGLGIASLMAVQAEQTRDWRPHIIAAAMDTLGH